MTEKSTPIAVDIWFSAEKDKDSSFSLKKSTKRKHAHGDGKLCFEVALGLNVEAVFFLCACWILFSFCVLGDDELTMEEKLAIVQEQQPDTANLKAKARALKIRETKAGLICVL